MTRDEAVTEIKQLASFRQGTTDDAVIRTYLQRVQEFYENGPVLAELPWFLRSDRSDRSTTAGEERVPIPADFLREAEPSALYFVPADTDKPEVELRKDDTDFLRNKYPRAETGEPKEYSLDGKYFRLFPTPDAIYTLRMVYYKQATVLTSNIENDWLKYAPWLLIGRAGRLWSTALRDLTGAKAFGEIEGEALKTLSDESEARKHANRRYQMGGVI